MTAPLSLDSPKSDLLAEVLRILSTEVLEIEGKLDPDSDLFLAGLDSLAIMQLVVRIESRFGVSLSSSHLTRLHFATPRQICNLLDCATRQPAQ